MTTHTELTENGRACHGAAVKMWSLGLSPIGLCVPGHIGVRSVNPGHAQECKDPKDWGKSPMWLWSKYQTQQPTLEEVDYWWRVFPYGNVGLVLGRIIRIDADGEKGVARLQEWSGGDLPDTWTFYSPASPTPQYLYRLPDCLEPY
jgi:hypothetical protein